MSLLDQAPTTLGHEFIDISSEVIAAILAVLGAGWAYASTIDDVNPTAQEIAITEHLRDGMRRAVNSPSYPWTKMLLVLPGTESRSRGHLLPDGRTDIPLMWIEIFLRHGEHDPHAVVECKRIDGSNADLCREYVIQGIDRFRSGKYGHNHAVGFMVGYLIAGSENEAASGVNRYLVGRGRSTEQLQKSRGTTSVWVSGHDRAGPLRSITLQHTFLGFLAAGDHS